MGVYPDYTVESGDHFKSIVNCQYGATGCDVFFQLQYQVGSGPITTYWQFHEKYEGLYYTGEYRPQPTGRPDVKFILRVANSSSTPTDWPCGRRRASRAEATPPPTPPPSGCTDKAAFIADVTVPD